MATPACFPNETLALSHSGRAQRGVARKRPEKTIVGKKGKTNRWCRGGELNSLRRPFQGRALPVSYPGTGAVKDSTGAMQGVSMF
jgi:hypothetical protein